MQYLHADCPTLGNILFTMSTSIAEANFQFTNTISFVTLSLKCDWDLCSQFYGFDSKKITFKAKAHFIIS